MSELEIEIDRLKKEARQANDEHQKEAKDLQNRINELSNDLTETLQALNSEEGLAAAFGKSNDNLSGQNLTKNMVIVPKEKIKELENAKKKLADLRATNDKLTAELKDKTHALKEITTQLSVTSNNLDKKNMENQRLREELEVRVTHDSKDLKKLKKSHKIAEDLKLELIAKEKTIKDLKYQIEIMEAKLLNMVKMVDRQRYTNQKDNQSMRLNHLYANKIMGDFPERRSSPFENTTNARDFSPKPFEYPVANRDSPLKSVSQEKPAMRVTSASAELDPLYVTNQIEPQDLILESHQNAEKFTLCCFLKANSPDFISPYMIREDGKLLVAGPVKSTGKYERNSTGAFINQRPFHFKKVYTQYDLEDMSQDLVGMYSADKIAFVVYGTPLNIKLFLILKMLMAMFGKIAIMTKEGMSFSLTLILQPKYSQILTDALNGLPGVQPSTDVKVNQVKTAQGLVSVTIGSNIPLLLEHLKKIFYDMLTHSSASSFSLIDLDIAYEPKRGSREPRQANQRLSIMRSQVQSVNQYNQFRDCFQSIVAACSDPVVSRYFSDAYTEASSRSYFLVLEPGKVSSFEESITLLDIHGQLDKFRVHGKQYDQLARARRAGSAQNIRARADNGAEDLLGTH